MFQLANVPSSRPLTIFGPHPLARIAASSFMVCSGAIQWLSQAISGHGAYISQVNRLIFLNNTFILAKARCQAGCPARGGTFGPSRENLSLARAQLIGGKLTKNGGNAGFLPVISRDAGSRCARKATISGFQARKSRFPRPKTPISETGSLLTLPSSAESGELRYRRWLGASRACSPDYVRITRRRVRTRAVAREFQREQPCPSTGLPTGACPG